MAWLAWLRKRLTFIEALGVHFIIGFLISLVCLWIFSELADEVFENEWVVQVDQIIATQFHLGATPLATQFFLAITALGGPVITIVGVMVGTFFLYKRWRFRLALWVIAVVGGQILNSSLKLWFARPRPAFDEPLVIENFYSFPSGHAMMSLILYGLLASLMVVNMPNRPRQLLVITVAALLIFLIGLSRIYLGVHYFSDVVAGFAAGGLWLSTCITALNFLRSRGMLFNDDHPPQLENQNAHNRNG